MIMIKVIINDMVYSIPMKLSVIRFTTLNIIIMVIAIIINIIKSHRITMKLSGIKLLNITVIIIIISIVKSFSITMTMKLSNFWYQIAQNHCHNNHHQHSQVLQHYHDHEPFKFLTIIIIMAVIIAVIIAIINIIKLLFSDIANFLIPV